MQGLVFILSLVVVANAQAKPRKNSGASRLPEFAACVQNTVYGQAEGECEARSAVPACVGLRRALEYSKLQTECLRRSNGLCLEYGHNGLTQSYWVSIAATHLSDFGTCVRKRYGSKDVSGSAEALADPEFTALLKRLNDGAGVFRLPPSTILFQTLEGSRFSEIIRNSDFGQDQAEETRYRLEVAADRLVKFGALPPVNEQENTFSLTRADDESTAQKLFQDYVAQGEPIPAGESLVQPNPATENAPAPRILSSPVASTEMVRPKPAPGRALSSFGLGLDRDLFDRVSGAYQRNAEGLRGVDQYIKSYRPEPAKDLGELLRRGGTL